MVFHARGRLFSEAVVDKSSCFNEFRPNIEPRALRRFLAFLSGIVSLKKAKPPAFLSSRRICPPLPELAPAIEKIHFGSVRMADGTIPETTKSTTGCVKSHPVVLFAGQSVLPTYQRTVLAGRVWAFWEILFPVPFLSSQMETGGLFGGHLLLGGGCERQQQFI